MCFSHKLFKKWSYNKKYNIFGAIYFSLTSVMAALWNLISIVCEKQTWRPDNNFLIIIIKPKKVRGLFIG